MLDIRAEHRLVSHYYDAAVGDAPWGEALERTAAALDSHATMLVIHRPSTMRVISVQSHNYPIDFLGRFFAGEIYANDPRNGFIGQVRPGTIYFDEMLYDVEEVERDPWVRASTDTLEMSSQVGARLRLPDGGEASLCILRATRETDYLNERVATIRRLAPRIEQACALGHLLERERATRDALLECLAAKADAIILLDVFGRPSFMNDAASRLLAEGDGLSFVEGELRCSRRPETITLRRLLSRTLGRDHEAAPRGGRLLVSRRSRRKPYVLTALAPPPRDCFLARHTIACIVHIQDLAAPPAPAAADLRSVFGLTARESDLAAMLTESARLDLAAARCGMAVNTARNHLQTIFTKTGTGSQAELIQLLGRIL